MNKKILTSLILLISVQAKASFFDFLTRDRQLPEKNFNTVRCIEVNDFDGPVRVKEVSIKLEYKTNLRRIAGERTIPGSLKVELVDGRIFTKEKLNFKRSGGGSGRNKLADELQARVSSQDASQWIELQLAAPTEQLYQDNIYSRNTDLTGGINIVNNEIDIWLDDQNDSAQFKDPLRCKVSLEQ